MMDPYGSGLPPHNGHDPNQPSRPPNGPQRPTTDAGHRPPPHNGCADVKPRLTKEQHDLLENHFKQQNKPTTATKRGYAERLGVSLDKINNWFQNRRAKAKQDLKKQNENNALNMNMNMNMNVNMYPFPLGDEQQQHQQQQQQQQPMQQQQPPPPAQSMAPAEFYAINADISPTCLPVQNVNVNMELPSSSMEPSSLGAQMAMHQAWDMHHLRSIPETDRPAVYNPQEVMQNFMAAAAGSSMMHANPAELPPQDSGFSYHHPAALGPPFSADLTFSVPAPETVACNGPMNGFTDWSGFDCTAMAAPVTAAGGPPPPQEHTANGTLSSQPSPFSGTQSTATTQSSSGPGGSSVTSVASMFSGYEQNQSSDMPQSSHDDDVFDQPYTLGPASVSEHALPMWSSNGQGQHFSSAELYQQLSASAQGLHHSVDQGESQHSVPAPADLESPPPFSDDIYSRRNSSTTNLANTIESITIQNGQSTESLKQPTHKSGLSSRRLKRPAALNPSTLRSSSYSSGMPSPGSNQTEHALRRIRSSGLPNAGGRVQKPTPGSAQRSPLALTFDTGTPPKFARTFSQPTTTTGHGGSLAPPTPLTPNEMGRFPTWQSHTVIRNHQPVPEDNSPQSLNVSWSVEQQSNGGVYPPKSSPPSTPLDLNQIRHAQFTNGGHYRDTPPQSAPATQQTFPSTAYMPPPQMPLGFRSTSDLTIVQPKPHHPRRPSLPETNQPQPDSFQVQFPVQLGNMGDLQQEYDNQFRENAFTGSPNGQQYQPSMTMNDQLFVHQYSPPQGNVQVGAVRRIAEPQPKNYIFANQGPHDFRT